MLLVRVKSRPEMCEIEVFQITISGCECWEVEMRPAGNDRVLSEGRVMRRRELSDWSLGTVRVWREGRFVIQIVDPRENLGTSMVVRAGKLVIWVHRLIDSKTGKDRVVKFEEEGLL